MYRVVLVFCYLGWVDFYFGYPTVSLVPLGLTKIWQNWLGCSAGRWDIQIKVNPTQVTNDQPHPVQSVKYLQNLCRMHVSKLCSSSPPSSRSPCSASSAGSRCSPTASCCPTCPRSTSSSCPSSSSTCHSPSTKSCTGRTCRRTTPTPGRTARCRRCSLQGTICQQIY